MTHFDEHYYLRHHTDVRQAVRLGQFASGYEHWIKFGQRENRSVRWLKTVSTSKTLKQTFKHSGDRGDIIYSLPVIMQKRGGDLYLDIYPQKRDRLSDGSLSLLTEEKAISMFRLLRSQPYINSCNLYKGEEIDYSLDDFRIAGHLWEINICERHCETFDINFNIHLKKWLYAKKVDLPYDIVVARSHRYRNEKVNWGEIYKFCLSPNHYHKRAVFIGHESEYKDFKKNVGNLDYLYTKDLYDVARVINSAKIFIGNQSCPYALAEGLKKNVIQEVFEPSPNCIFKRANALYLRESKTEYDLRDWEYYATASINNSNLQ